MHHPDCFSSLWPKSPIRHSPQSAGGDRKPPGLRIDHGHHLQRSAFQKVRLLRQKTESSPAFRPGQIPWIGFFRSRQYTWTPVWKGQSDRHPNPFSFPKELRSVFCLCREDQKTRLYILALGSLTFPILSSKNPCVLAR